MSAPNDGGPAFPTGHLNRADVEPGMALRDWFAGRALNGLLSRSLRPNSQGNTSTNWASVERYGALEVAKFSYEYADAMLAERAKKGTP